MAKASLWADFIVAVNTGKANVRCSSVGELVIPFNVIDHEGSRVENVTFRTGAKIDLTKRIPRDVLLNSKALKSYLLKGTLVLTN